MTDNKRADRTKENIKNALQCLNTSDQYLGDAWYTFHYDTNRNDSIGDIPEEHRANQRFLKAFHHDVRELHLKMRTLVLKIQDHPYTVEVLESTSKD